jgi:hypothetical protein
MSKIELISFTYADMYNVTLQEFGHCLGLSHVGSQGGVEPTSDLKHPEHDPMNGFYTHDVGFEGTHLHCISTLDVVAVEFVFSYPADNATIYLPVAAYGSTCEPPRSDWRSLLPAGSTFTPTDDEPKPTPSPGPSEAPSSEPSGEPAASEPSTTEIWSPQDASSIPRDRFKRVEGTVSFEGEGDPVVEVAVVRMKGASCRWWDASRRAFVPGVCDIPRWNGVKGWAGWRLKLKKSLPAGSYRALARSSNGDYVEECCEPGRNEISFTLF